MQKKCYPLAWSNKMENGIKSQSLKTHYSLQTVATPLDLSYPCIPPTNIWPKTKQLRSLKYLSIILTPFAAIIITIIIFSRSMSLKFNKNLLNKILNVFASLRQSNPRVNWICLYIVILC